MINLLNSSGPATSLFPIDDNFRTAFNIAGWAVPWYAIFVILGFFIAILIACYRAKTFYKIKYDCLYYFTIILIPAALFGARFWSACIGDLQWENFFKPGSGGLAIQGGVVAVVIAALIYFPLILKNPKYHVRVEVGDKVYIEKPSLWIILDIITPTILIGQAIGRWGNFFNGELFGDPVDENNMQWLKVLMPGVFEKMHATHTIDGTAVVSGTMYQPLFLYEQMINIPCFFIIYFLIPNIKKIKIGVIGSSYFVIYGITRFAMEPLRNSAFEFTSTYVLNGLLLALGLIFMIIAQFIAPKYRYKNIIYKIWVSYIRLSYLKLLIIFNTKKGIEIKNIDPNLEKYGFDKIPSFTRNRDEMLYYGPNE